ncbi:MAG: hypothetical protein M1587_12290 [Thaumarchaeota archaeon]|nr:hypothetical protein [Nitrososphaerota archaeon]MCL5067614.1 hypothetical protein [Nitrososphaerota archaeon]
MNASSHNPQHKFIIVALAILITLSFTMPTVAAVSPTTVSPASPTPTSTTLPNSASNATLNSILQSPPVHIDQVLFMSTVPTSANIGQNYTVEVLISNNSDQPVPILLQLNVPLNMVNVRPFIILETAEPEGQFLANFTIVAFSKPNQGTISITAILSIWFVGLMNQPQIVQQISANIYRVNPSNYSQVIFLVTVAGIASAVAIVSLYLRKSRHSGQCAELNSTLTAAKLNTSALDHNAL